MEKLPPNFDRGNFPLGVLALLLFLSGPTVAYRILTLRRRRRAR